MPGKEKIRIASAAATPKAADGKVLEEWVFIEAS
jgi:hypothetical protein